MATSGTTPFAPGPRTPAIHTGVIIIGIASGSYALVALLVGSPLAIGVALALSGACWIATHFIEWTAERARVPHTQAVPAARFNRGYASCHVVFVGAAEYSTRPAPRPRTRLPGARIDGVDGGQDWGFAA